MGISFSCPFATYSDVENALESVVVKSISFGDDNVRTPVRSVNFGSLDLEPRILKSSGSGKMIVERSVSFKGTELEKMISHKTPTLDEETDDSVDCANGMEAIQKSSIFDPANPHHEAAIKLQKVYKSFRTRRKLADCAVLVEQSWWKLLDFAELKRSSISFFDIEKHETAISRWSRARTRAAKVGKGLSKNDKAQKLALQHWLEAIDPRHRYGHNLHFYYVKWLHSKSREPFFYWLDIGEGKEVNLEKCPRSKLQQQCIKYLGPMERKAYEAVVEDGKFMYQQTGELLHTTGDAKWIFVLSTSKNLYVGKKQKGRFQHSSFLAGGVTLAAGRLIVENGVLKAVWPHSGHYRPTEENFQDFLSFLRENNVDLADVQTSPMDGEERLLNKQRSSKHLRSNSSEEDLIQTVDELEIEETIAEDSTLDSRKSAQRESSGTPEEQKSTPLRNFSRKLTILQVPKRNESLERIESDIHPPRSSINSVVVGPQTEDGYESADEGFTKDQSHRGTMQSSSNEEHEGNAVEHIPEEEILRRINCKKETKSYQLGRQLSCKWTTGAGPRIGCVRDYPSELQVRALEQVNLSPRSMGHSRTAGGLSRRISSPSDFGGEEAATAFSSMLAKAKSLQMILPLSSPQSSPLGKGHQSLQ